MIKYYAKLNSDGNYETQNWFAFSKPYLHFPVVVSSLSTSTVNIIDLNGYEKADKIEFWCSYLIVSKINNIYTIAGISTVTENTIEYMTKRADYRKWDLYKVFDERDNIAGKTQWMMEN